MNILEIVESFDNLSEYEQKKLLDILVQKRKSQQNIKDTNQESFWEIILRFREKMKQEEIVFTDEDFANLRDRSPGREVDL
ncbi:MAG TPA: hypothetical protein V6D13_18515 [Halomicronema sp.]